MRPMRKRTRFALPDQQMPESGEGRNQIIQSTTETYDAVRRSGRLRAGQRSIENEAPDTRRTTANVEDEDDDSPSSPQL
jgi:hypothetical protein